MPSKPKGAHHKGDFQRRGASLRQGAYQDGGTRCWRCGRTLEQVRARNPKAVWTAGHVRTGDPTSPLKPECSPCNYGDGARITNTRTTPRTPLTW